MSPVATSAALQRLARPLRSAAGVLWALRSVGGAVLVLGLLAWLVRLGAIQAPVWVLAAWGAAVAVLGLSGWLMRRELASLSSRPLAIHLEENGRWRQGAITAFLDGSVTGTSDELFLVADQQRAAEVNRDGNAAVAALLHRYRQQVMVALGVVLAGIATLVTAGTAHGNAALLWHPSRAWDAIVSPLRLRAAAPLIDRGARAQFLIEAIGRHEATLWTRSPGEPWSARAVALDSAGRAQVVVGPLEADLYARLTSNGHASDTVQVRVRIPAFLGSLQVTARYPEYLHLESEVLPVGTDSLLLPAGTKLDAKGQATTRLRTASWILGRVSTLLEVHGTEFTGSLIPIVSGSYRLVLGAEDGGALAGDTVRLAIRVVPDSAPHVEVPVPGVDTVAPTSLQLPMVIDVRDDHGIKDVAVETWRTTGGSVGAHRVEPVSLPAGAVDRAILSLTLDLSQRGLVPGDTLHYQVRAVDNSPRGQVGRSREFVLVVPSKAEARAAEQAATSQVGKRIDSLVAQAKAVQRQTEDLSRERQRSSSQNGKTEEPLSFEEAKKAERVAATQDQMLKDAAKLEESLRELQKAAEAAGIEDSAFKRRMDEVREQLEKALSPELRKKLAELQQALKNLDAPKTKEALQQLAEAQKQLREALERSRELFKRAALEGQMGNLQQEAKEVVKEQKEWTDKVTTADTSKAAARESDLAKRTDSLAAGLEQAAKQVEAEKTKAEMNQSASQARQAAQQMQQASKMAKSGKRQSAKKEGEQASQKMESVQQQVQKERQDQQDEWREEVMRALDRALAETTRLTKKQLVVADAFRRGASIVNTRTEQSVVEDGVQRLLQQVAAVAGKNALVGPTIGAALATARQEMAKAREAVSSASANLREASEHAGEAIDALNVASYQMLRSRGDVSGSASGSGLAEAMERMTKMAQQQGGVSQQAGGLLPMMGSTGAQEQLRQLGQQQRALAQELERLRAQSNLSTVRELAEEAKDLAKSLEAGRLDRETVDRQERLFRRMLDAGRTLQGKEEDEKKERKSETAKGEPPSIPPALRAQLQDPNGTLRLPSWEELQHFSPEERRLVADYFRRLASGAIR